MTWRHVILPAHCDITNRLQTFFFSLACPPVYIWPNHPSVMWLKPSLPATLWGQCASIFFLLPLRLKKKTLRHRAERSSRPARPLVVIIANTGFAFGVAWLQEQGRLIHTKPPWRKSWAAEKSSWIVKTNRKVLVAFCCCCCCFHFWHVYWNWGSLPEWLYVETGCAQALLWHTCRRVYSLWGLWGL